MTIKSCFFSVIIITILSCNHKRNGYEIDCEHEKKQAQNDFKYKNYTWTIFSGLGYDYLGEKEFKKLLNQNNIKTDSVSVSCVVFPNDKYMNCGKIEMNRLIEKKFGNKFIDSLKYKAKQQFVIKHPEEIFAFEQCDESTRYPNSTISNQSEKMRADYFAIYPVPKEYHRKNEEFYSYTSADFIITKTGEIKDLTVESTFQNKKNYIFEEQFNKQLKNFVLNTKWIPAKISGVNVDSYYGVTIHYD